MRHVITFLLIAAFGTAVAQICPTQPSSVPVSGWTQTFDAEWFDDASYLDGLNMPELGTGVSDDHLAIATNQAISAFIGVKRRAVIAPADNLPFVGGHYQAPTGYAPTSVSNPTLTSLASWNFMVYVDLGDLTFADVDVRLYLDFDACYASNSNEMFELDMADLMALSNLDPADISELATNQNLASNAWAVFDDANIQPMDPTASGFYTIALAIYDDCGNQKLWHEVVVAVGDSFLPDFNGNGILDTADVFGCTNENACNFSCNVTVDDGSCDYVSCSGCSIADACNYAPNATTTDTESCLFPIDVYGSEHVDCDGECLNDADGDGTCDQDEIAGCQDPDGCNFNSSATDQGACTFAAEGYDCEGNCLIDTDGDGVCDAFEVSGCVDSSACNFEVAATEADGSCEYASCAGCTIEQACNYDASATISDASVCVFPADGFDCAGDCLEDADGDGVCDFQEFAGCTDDAACNYSSAATDDDGSCNFALEYRNCNGQCLNDADGDGICDEEEVIGCMEPWACNYNAEATTVGTCDTTSCAGCKDESACNYDADATLPDYSACTYPTANYDCSGTPLTDANQNGIADEEEVMGCTDATATNYNPLATTDDGSCSSAVLGCLIPGLPNYDPSATVQDTPVLDACGVVLTGGLPGQLLLPSAGCTTPAACNFDPAATEDDGSCEFESCVGCTNPLACDYDESAIYNSGCIDFESCYGCTASAAGNYDPSATIDDGSCSFTGCTTPSACNYDAAATTNDGSCDFVSCVGCTSEGACNYDPAATLDSGQCALLMNACDSCSDGAVVDNDADNDGVCDADEVLGCVNPVACNFNGFATEADGSCLFATGCDYCSGATDGTGEVISGDSDENGTCDALEVPGCLNANACNYDADATVSDGTCEFTSCVGCIDELACNYDAEATLSEPISCEYAPFGYDCFGDCLGDEDLDGVCDANEILGCTDAAACNFDPQATDDNGSCVHPQLHYDCDGACLVDEDNDGVCDALEVLGCTNAAACNFNESATEADGSCEYVSCAACGDADACNYDTDALVVDLTLCTYPPVGYDDCAGTVCTDSDEDGNCDFDELPTCVGEFDAPVLVMSGVVELDALPAAWPELVTYSSVTDEHDVEISFLDYPGRLETGNYSVTRVYALVDACGNSAEAAQLLVAIEQTAGCTNPAASNFSEDAVTEDGSCSYDPVCPGDLNLDGIIGASDLLILLSGFGIPCP